MRLSINEFETLARKAAVGAGVHHGYAAEAAAALVWLAATGIDCIPGYVRILDGWSQGAREAVAADHANRACILKTRSACPASLLYAGPALRDFSRLIAGGRFLRIEARLMERPGLALGWLARPPRGNSIEVRCREPGGSETRWRARLPADDDPGRLSVEGDISDERHADLLVTACIPDQRTPIASRAAGVLEPNTRALFARGLAVAPSDYAALRRYFDLTLVPDSEQSRRHGAGAGLVDHD